MGAYGLSDPGTQTTEDPSFLVVTAFRQVDESYNHEKRLHSCTCGFLDNRNDRQSSACKGVILLRQYPGGWMIFKPHPSRHGHEKHREPMGVNSIEGRQTCSTVDGVEYVFKEVVPDDRIVPVHI